MQDRGITNCIAKLCVTSLMASKSLSVFQTDKFYEFVFYLLPKCFRYFLNVHECLTVYRDIQCFHFKYPRLEIIEILF